MSTPEQILRLERNVARLKRELAANHAQVLPLLLIRQNIRISLLSEIEALSNARNEQDTEGQGKHTEPCPVCQNPEAVCEHGVRDAGNGMLVHLWYCPECGDSAPFVGFDCPRCAALIGAQAVTVSSGVSDAA